MILDIILIALLAFVGLIVIALAWFAFLKRRYPVPDYADDIYIITTSDRWQIRLHRRRSKTGFGEPVFFMHSLASNHLNFEIPHGYSVVDYLSRAGYDCWTVDTRACRDAIPPRRGLRYNATVDDLVCIDVPAALKFIREITGYEKIHWVGHSMGGMVLYAYDLKFDGGGIVSAATLGSPPGFKNYSHVSHDALVAINRVAFPVLSFCFRALAPFYTIWHPSSRLIPINWDNVHSKLHARELFYAAEMPLPGIGAQMDSWASSTVWKMCDGTLDIDANLPKLKTPLLAIFGGIDPFVSASRANAFFDSIENPDKRMITLSRANGNSANYNHIELAFARHGESEVYAPILEWLREHPARTLENGEAKVARKPCAKAKIPAKTSAVKRKR